MRCGQAVPGSAIHLAYARRVTTAQLLLRGAHIDHRVSGAVAGDAVAVADGRILAVGAAADLTDLVGPHTTVLDLAGASLLPRRR